jgi:hypothetical protein
VTWVLDRLLAPAPAERLAMLRILVGGYAVVWSLARLPEHLAHTTQPAHRWRPPGVLAPFDAPLPDAAMLALALGTPLLGLAFAAGWRFAILGPSFAVALLTLTTLDSSWQQIFHTENLLVLHAGILALAPGAADALTVRRFRQEERPPLEPHARYGWPGRLAAAVVVVAYLVAGLAKLTDGGLAWADGDALRNLIAFDNTRKAVLGDVYSPFGTWLVGYGWVFPPLAVATLAIELGGGVTLLGGRWRTGWVVAAWLFHVGVLALMAILFAYQLSGIAFAPFFRLERLPLPKSLRSGAHVAPNRSNFR